MWDSGSQAAQSIALALALGGPEAANATGSVAEALADDVLGRGVRLEAQAPALPSEAAGGDEAEEKKEQQPPNPELGATRRKGKRGGDESWNVLGDRGQRALQVAV